jgi:hypothetical protein
MTPPSTPHDFVHHVDSTVIDASTPYVAAERGVA